MDGSKTSICTKDGINGSNKPSSKELLEIKRQAVRAIGGQIKVDQQHANGKLDPRLHAHTILERIVSKIT